MRSNEVWALLTSIKSFLFTRIYLVISQSKHRYAPVFGLVYYRKEDVILRKRSLRDWVDEYHDNVPQENQEGGDCLSRMAWVDVPDYEESCPVRDNYEAAMSKRSDYLCSDLAAHLSNHGVRFCRDHEEGSALVGCRYIAEELGVFVVSHFAPATRKGGVEMLKAASKQGTPFVFCVPENLASQLVRLGFWDTKIDIPQWFAGKYVQKRVVVNKATTQEDLQELAKELL